MARPNLIVTYDATHAATAEEHIRSALSEVGQSKVRMLRSDVEGVAQLKVDGDPKRVVHSLRALAAERPEVFAGTHRWIPVERFVRASERQIEKAAKSMDERIHDDESWAIKVEKHGSSKHTKEFLEIAARFINHPTVDLSSPEKQARFEIVGNHVAASLLTPEDSLNVNDFREARPDANA